MTNYYLDFENGSDSNDGSTPALAFKTTQYADSQMTSSAYRLILRRSISGGADVLTGDVTLNSNSAGYKIMSLIEADYDDDWGDFATCTSTGTFTFGSKTVTFSADVSSEISAGDSIYVSTDDNRLFSYDVDSVSTTTVTLYLPFKGTEGSGWISRSQQSGFGHRKFPGGD